MSANMLSEDYAGEEKVETEQEQEEVVAPAKPKRRGPKAMLAQHKKKAKKTEKAPKK